MGKFCLLCGGLAVAESKYCGICVVKVKEDFEKIKEFLKYNPGSSASDVATATGISINTITRFLKDGMLSTL
jgi:hypothetical protein